MKQPSSTIFNMLQSTARGGLEEMFIEYTKLLCELGYQVVCIVPHSFQYLAQLSTLPIKVEHLHAKGHVDIFRAIQLEKLRKKYQPVCLLSHNGRSNALVNLWRFFYNRLHNQALATIAVSHICTKRMKSFDAVIAVSKNLHEKLQTTGFSGELFYLPNFISTDTLASTQTTHLSADQTERQSNPQHHTQPTRQLVLGSLTRLSPEKNIAFLIHTMAALKKDHPQLDIKLNIAGDGECRDELEELVADYALTENVSFLGWIQDKHTFFNSIDVLAFPSPKEPFGIIVLESFYFETPVLASNAYGPAEIIDDKKDGLLFHVNDVAHFIDNILWLVHHPEKISQITDAAKLKLEHSYTPRAAATSLNDILNQALPQACNQ